MNVGVFLDKVEFQFTDNALTICPKCKREIIGVHHLMYYVQVIIDDEGKLVL